MQSLYSDTITLTCANMTQERVLILKEPEDVTNLFFI